MLAASKALLNEINIRGLEQITYTYAPLIAIPPPSKHPAKTVTSNEIEDQLDDASGGNKHSPLHHQKSLLSVNILSVYPRISLEFTSEASQKFSPNNPGTSNLVNCVA
jgi:hypothetical protein